MKLCGNSVLSQNFYTKTLGEISVFYAVKNCRKYTDFLQCIPWFAYHQTSSRTELKKRFFEKVYPTVVMVMNAHQNPSHDPSKNEWGNSDGFRTVSCVTDRENKYMISNTTVISIATVHTNTLRISNTKRIVSFSFFTNFSTPIITVHNT